SQLDRTPPSSPALMHTASDLPWLTSPWFIVPAIYALVSSATFVAFGWDKWRAKRGGQRVSERTLHMLELFGGWPGALAAQRLFRHKSEKRSFKLVLWFIVALHVAGWGLATYFAIRNA